MNPSYFLEGRVPSRPAVVQSSTMAEMELDLPSHTCFAPTLDSIRNRADLWRAGFHPGQRPCRRAPVPR